MFQRKKLQQTLLLNYRDRKSVLSCGLDWIRIVAETFSRRVGRNEIVKCDGNLSAEENGGEKEREL